MSTTSRRLSLKGKVAKNQHTSGISKGGFCVRPKDFGLATKGNPYKGQGFSSGNKGKYDDMWDRYKRAKGNA